MLVVCPPKVPCVLKAISQAWGPYGELAVASDTPDYALPAGASTWFTVTFKVLVKCPEALPVQFTLDTTSMVGRPPSACQASTTSRPIRTLPRRRMLEAGAPPIAGAEA